MVIGIFFNINGKCRQPRFDVSVYSHVVVLICCYKDSLCDRLLLAFRVETQFSYIPPQACFNWTWPFNLHVGGKNDWKNNVTPNLVVKIKTL